MTPATSETQYPFSNSHNVYILGAGFSKDSGMPLMHEFLNRMRDARDGIGSERQDERRAIERVFAFRHDAAGAACRTCLDVENIEELFSLAAASQGQPEIAESITRAIAATLDFCRREERGAEYWMQIDVAEDDGPTNAKFPVPRAWPELERAPRGKSCHRPVAEIFAGIISGKFVETNPAQRNTVITFNYDLVLEEALRVIEAPFNYGGTLELDPNDSAYSTDAAATSILKVHGSINWTRGSGGDNRARARPSYESVWRDQAVPILTPPTWRKEFSDVFARVWDAAVSSMRTATNIIVVGFSMPPTDTHFKYLLAAGLQNNISLRRIWFVNPTLPSERLHQVLRPELFANGVVELGTESHNTAIRFFKDRVICKAIGRPWHKGIIDIHP
jgi:hypothetical protein